VVALAALLIAAATWLVNARTQPTAPRAPPTIITSKINLAPSAVPRFAVPVPAATFAKWNKPP
jgi:hypothetical protein